MKQMQDLFWLGLTTAAYYLANRLERGRLFEKDEARIEVSWRGRLHYSIVFKRLVPPKPVEPVLSDVHFWKDLRESGVGFAKMLERAGLFNELGEARTENGRFWGTPKGEKPWDYDVTVHRMHPLETSRRRRKKPRAH